MLPRKLDVHRYEDREHNESDECRPLEQKLQHDENEADILMSGDKEPPEGFES